jgi:hypothetical protein
VVCELAILSLNRFKRFPSEGAETIEMVNAPTHNGAVTKLKQGVNERHWNTQIRLTYRDWGRTAICRELTLK